MLPDVQYSGNTSNLAYDANGNMTNDGYNTSIVYDYTNHPVRFDNADYLVEMEYDTLGRRIEKKSTKRTDGTIEVEEYILDGARVISDADSVGAVHKDYIWGIGIDELLATAKGRSRKYDFYLNNSLGSIMNIVNDKAEVQESYKYKVYGSVTIYDKKGEVINKSKEKNRYMFTGRELESETKLFYYRTRFYSTGLGRFGSRDSAGYFTGINFNLYSYVENKPVNFFDPAGYSKAKVRIWNESSNGWGHAALDFGGADYISFWPTNPGKKGYKYMAGSSPSVFRNKKYDAYYEGPADSEIEVGCLDEDAMRNERFAVYKDYVAGELEYHPISNNCATVAARVLTAGMDKNVEECPYPLPFCIHKSCFNNDGSIPGIDTPASFKTAVECLKANGCKNSWCECSIYPPSVPMPDLPVGNYLTPVVAMQ